MLHLVQEASAADNVFDMSIDDVINYGDSLLAIGKTRGTRVGGPTVNIDIVFIVENVLIDFGAGTVGGEDRARKGRIGSKQVGREE